MLRARMLLIASWHRSAAFPALVAMLAQSMGVPPAARYFPPAVYATAATQTDYHGRLRQTISPAVRMQAGSLHYDTTSTEQFRCEVSAAVNNRWLSATSSSVTQPANLPGEVP